MNYNKLLLSFFCLFLMSLIHLFVSLFILKHLILSIGAIITTLLCLVGLFYISNHTHKKKDKSE